MTDTPRPRVLFLMTSRTYRAGAFLQAAEKLGFLTVVGSEVRHVLADLNPSAHLHLDFRDLEAATDAIIQYHSFNPLTAVIAPDDDGLVVAAMASDALGLTHNSVDAVAAARNKYLMRQILAGAGLPSPWFERHPFDAGPAQVSSSVPYPCVLKPLALSGSRGVIRADNQAEFIAAVHRIAAILKEPDAAVQSGIFGGEILIESYLPGQEVALEGMMAGGRLQVLAIFDKPDPLVGPYFEETIYLTPSRLDSALQIELVSNAEAGARALGIFQGPIHAELRLNDNGIFLVELAPRSIGGYCSRALRFAGGISLEELILRQAVGEAVGSISREGMAAGVMMIPTPGAGKLTGISGLEAARRVRGVEDVIITVPVGKPMKPPPEGNEYLGFIFARSSKPEEVEEALRTAHACLRIEIEVEFGVNKAAFAG